MKDVESVDRRPAGCRRHVAGEDAQRRRFARPVRAEEPDDLPLGHLEADVVDRQGLTICLGQLRNGNHAGSFFSRCRGPRLRRCAGRDS